MITPKDEVAAELSLLSVIYCTTFFCDMNIVSETFEKLDIVTNKVYGTKGQSDCCLVRFSDSVSSFTGNKVCVQAYDKQVICPIV